MRTPFHFRVTGRPLFGWYHAPDVASPRDAAVVICQPLGHEYLNAHRSMRHLADRLAAAGIPALRFDYEGTGDSSGRDDDEDRVGAWIESVRQAVQALRRRSGCTRVSFVGLRMGATLAALAARELDTASLVLWAPCARGRAYVRELKALAAAGSGAEFPRGDARIQAGGFVLTETAQRAISGINLEEILPRATRVLIGSRDDLMEDHSLCDRWSAAGLAVEQRPLPGYVDMLAVPHHARVPDQALAAIVQWVAAGAAPVRPLAARDAAHGAASPSSGSCLIDGVQESVFQFGDQQATFGVLSQPARGAIPATPVVVLANAGATHHVGPGGLYVQLARTLSRAGLRCLRFDLPGLGDSAIADADDENDSYPPHASGAVASAIDALKERQGATTFVVAGLCSGAHTAFHAALDLSDRAIVEAVLINPLTYYYTPGMPLDFQSAQPDTPWQRRLDALRRLCARWTPAQAVAEAGKAAVHAARRRWARPGPNRDRRLERDLGSLAGRARQVTFVFSRFDPGHDLLLSEARRTVRQLIIRGDASLVTIPRANHTFDAEGPRSALLRTIEAHLVERYLRPSAPPATRIRLSKFVAQFGCGGTERQFVNLGLSLDRGRFALEYGCMSRWGPLATELTDRDVPLHEYPIRHLYGVGAARQQWRLARHLRRHRIQVLHAYNFYSNVFAIPAAWTAGVPVIIASIRDRGVYLTDAQRHVQRLVCRLADCILVNADAIKEWLVGDGYDPSNIVVIRNGIDLARFDAPPVAGTRHELGIPEGAPIVAMIARLNPKKGVEDFIDAAAIVSRTRPHVRFLIVGEGHVSSHGTFSEDTAYRQSISDRTARLGLRDALHLTGYRPDVPALLSELAVSVLPSHSEGLSNTLLESMAAGVPVVATRVGGTPEIIEDGVTGLLVPPRDPDALAQAIGDMLDNPDLARRLSAAGRHSVRERFAMDRMVRATEQLYIDLLVRRAAEPGWPGGLRRRFSVEDSAGLM